jgi:hypothetical protein
LHRWPVANGFHGAEISFFSDLQEEIEREVREAEAKRWMDEEQVEVERKRVEEEGERRAATAAKMERLAARRAALNETRWAAMLKFRVKTLSREYLQKRNTEFVDEHPLSRGPKLERMRMKPGMRRRRERPTCWSSWLESERWENWIWEGRAKTRWRGSWRRRERSSRIAGCLSSKDQCV